MEVEKRDIWFKFFPSNWLSNPKLRLCSRAARGVWADFVAIANSSGDPVGFLCVGTRTLSPKDLARLTGDSEEELIESIKELEDSGVLSRSEEGVIYCRKTVRDNDLKVKRQKSGQLGGLQKQANAEGLLKQKGSKRVSKRSSKRSNFAIANAVAKCSSSSSSINSSSQSKVSPVPDPAKHPDVFEITAHWESLFGDSAGPSAKRFIAERLGLKKSTPTSPVTAWTKAQMLEAVDRYAAKHAADIARKGPEQDEYKKEILGFFNHQKGENKGVNQFAGPENANKALLSPVAQRAAQTFQDPDLRVDYVLPTEPPAPDPPREYMKPGECDAIMAAVRAKNAAKAAAEAKEAEMGAEKAPVSGPG